MDYFVNINGTTHKLVQGFTISEEYNETLDSANIIISDSPQLDINPYDDVFIYSEYCGYYDEDLKKFLPNFKKKFVFKGYPVNADNYLPGEMPYFYKHFLIDQFNEEMIILGNSNLTTRYKYTIDLFSETKGLETVQAPNISITQNLKRKTSTLNYINRFVGLYNKDKRISLNNNVNNWDYQLKYQIPFQKKKYYLSYKEIFEIPSSFDGIIEIFDFEGTTIGEVELNEQSLQEEYGIVANSGARYFSQGLIQGSFSKINFINTSYLIDDSLDIARDIFKESFSPDFTLNNPSLRQILEKLFITKDCIPVVVDDEIFALDITKRRGKFDLTKGEINYITGSKSSDNFCTDLKRTYSDALSQESTGRYTEYLGFRNCDTALMTLENMRVETRFPIYKINKFYMCYFKKITLFDYSQDINNPTKYERIFLCKQDISKLIKLNSERNVLSQDISEFNEFLGENFYKATIDDLAKYKMSTLGYDIGSNQITGWGEKFAYPVNFFWQNEVKSYLECLFIFMDRKYKYGIYDFDYIVKKIKGITSSELNGIYMIDSSSNILESMVIPDYPSYDTENFIDEIKNWFSDKVDDLNLTLYLKHLFFQIDYQPFYNGTIVHSKWIGKDGITINDNPSSSLTLLELDGLSQKEKINRYGNKGLQINARYTNINDIQKLGSVYEYNNDKDIIIFHKQYAINSNVINCTYYGSKDYVLKNYFTSVYAKHRTYNLMSYAESIRRSENEKMYLFLSKTKQYEELDNKIEFSKFEFGFTQSLFSFYKYISEFKYNNKYENKEKLNYGYFVRTRHGKEEYFVTDSNIFISGESLCLNINMQDNVNVGTYIKEMKNNYLNVESENYQVGSTQDFVWVTDDSTEDTGGTTGTVQTLEFCFGHFGGNDNNFIDEDKIYSSEYEVKNLYTYKILKLPKIDALPEITNNIGLLKNIYKDNKERIDMTIQFEPVHDEDIFFSHWLFKLSDLYGIYPKFVRDVEYSFTSSSEKIKDTLAASREYDATFTSISPVLVIIIDKSNPNWLENYRLQIDNFKGTFLFDESNYNLESHNKYTRMEAEIKNVYNVSDEKLTIQTDVSLQYTLLSGDKEHIAVAYPNENFTFTKTYFNSLGSPDEAYKAQRKKVLSDLGLEEDEAMTKYNVYFYQFPNGRFHGKYFYCWPSGLSSGEDYVSQGFFYGYGTDITSDVKRQNLFWVISPSGYELKDYMVYDEYSNLDNFTLLTFEDDISIIFPNDNRMTIRHPANLSDKYIMCYYKEEQSQKYNFVFGFKPNDSGITDIYISKIRNKDLSVYNQAHIKIGEIPNKIKAEN